MPTFTQDQLSAYARSQGISLPEALALWNAGDDVDRQEIQDTGDAQISNESDNVSPNPDLVDVLGGDTGTVPAADGIANPTSVGDDIRLGENQKRASQIATDARRAKVNSTKKGLPFFDQLKNLVLSDDTSDVASTQSDDDELDAFAARYKRQNSGAEPPIELWLRAKDDILRGSAKSNFDGVTVKNSRYAGVSYVDTRDVNAPAAKPEERVSLVGERLVRYAEGTKGDSRDESDAPVFLIDALIWIQGVEVSEFVQGEIRISLSGTKGNNSATFTLDNSSNRFAWTERNLYDIHGASAIRANAPYLRDLEKTLKEIERIDRILRGGGSLTAEEQDALDLTGALLPLDRANLIRRIRFTQQELIKEQIYEYKADPKRNPPIRNPKNTITHARFDLSPSRCIFGRMDPIRIFSLYPWRVPGKAYETETTFSATGAVENEGEQVLQSRKELWLPEFTGYVNNVSFDEDDLNGTSRITIDCVDIKQAVLRRMRVSADLTSGLEVPLSAMGFRTGETAQTRDSLAGPQNIRDVNYQDQFKDNTEGWFNIDNTTFYDDNIVTRYNQPFPNMSLEEAIRDVLVPKGKITVERNNRGVRGIEFGGNFYYDSLNFTQSEARDFLESWHKFCLFGPKRRPWTRDEVNAVGKGTTTDGSFSPNKVRLWFLLPIEGSGPRNLSDLSQLSSPFNHNVNWTNRQEIIQNFAESLDYNYMITPTGDIIVEFQMADFRPEDFGEFKQSFRVDKHLIATQIGDEQEAPPSGLIVTTNYVAGSASSGGAIGDAQLIKTYAYSPYIAARYGLEVVSETIPFLLHTDQKIAQQRAVMLYQRRLSQSHAMTFSFSYRPFLLPNRPMHHLRRMRIGSVVSIDKTLTISAQPKGECAVGLEYVRMFTGHYRSNSDLIGDNESNTPFIDALAAGASTEDAVAAAKLRTVSKLNPDQAKDIRTKGMDPTDFAALRGIDSFESGDPIELQVFTTVAAGESTPTSARVGWNGTSILAPASGIYVLDVTPDLQQTDTSSAEPVDEIDAEDVGDLAPIVADDGPKDDKFKFAGNPLASMSVKSNFGLRIEPVGKDKGKKKGHTGMDLRATAGTDILAVETGVIIRAGSSQAAPGTPYSGSLSEYGTGGNIVLLKTDSGFLVQYLHLDDSGRGAVVFGQKVTAGQVIGKTGNTGSKSSGQHLHLDVIPQDLAVSQKRAKASGVKVDPRDFLPGPLGGRGPNK